MLKKPLLWLKAFCCKLALWLVSAALAAVIVLLSHSRFFQPLEQRAFDFFTVITSPNEQATPIFIVGIDDASIAALGTPWPWPRSTHAKLIEALNQAGAGTIVFDVIFERPTSPKEDGAFAQALQKAGNVVLAANLVVEDSAYGTLQHRQEPMAELARAAAGVGMAAVPMDEDRSVRRLPEEHDALWRVALQSLKRRVPDLPVDFLPPKGAFLKYLGPPQTFTYISYVDAMKMASQPGAFDNALVLVGRIAAITTDITAAQADTFVTPFTGQTGKVTPGVEIHATAMENAIRSLSIGPVHPAVRDLLLALASFGCVFSLAGSRLGINALITGAWLAVMTGGSFALWQFQQMFLPPVAFLLLPIGVCSGRVGLAARQEQQKRLALKRTFSLYLAESVVDQLAAHPERLELGGELKEITLLFTDLEGFTTLAEGMSPPRIAHLLNEYFELMTQAVFRQEGTLDKFIGDAVMAFWNAPMPQADHPQRAVACAKDMLAALADFNVALREKGRPPINMRIGIHTGVAVVGNLGCPSRFSFTALGDAVNLASRLESANKDHNTRILMSKATVDQLPPSWPTQYIGEIKVKGREEPVKVYTLRDGQLPE